MCQPFRITSQMGGETRIGTLDMMAAGRRVARANGNLLSVAIRLYPLFAADGNRVQLDVGVLRSRLPPERAAAVHASTAMARRTGRKDSHRIVFQP